MANRLPPDQRQNQIWSWLFIRAKTGATKSEVARGIGISEGSADNYFRALERDGRVRRTGETRMPFGHDRNGRQMVFAPVLPGAAEGRAAA
jgi:predicted transcriptional regulator